MCRQTLTERLKTLFKVARSKIIALLEKLGYVCTTADCWSARSKSFLGMTCHWLDPVTLERRTICLGMRRIFGSHTYDLLAQKLEEMNTEFGIKDKIVQTVTDSGSNFIKAFKVFGADLEIDENDEEASGEDSDLVLFLFCYFL